MNGVFAAAHEGCPTNQARRTLLQVSGRDPREGYDDEVSFGRESPPRSTSRLLISVAAVCLGLGFLAGGQSDILPRGDLTDGSSSVPPVATGGISQFEGASSGAEFQLPVFNPGEEEVEVTLLDLGGWGAGHLESRPVSITPDTWRAVWFSAPADCEDPLPDPVLVVSIQADASTDKWEGEVPIPDDHAVVEYHEVVCDVSDPVTPGQLAGVWLLETAYGPQSAFAGIHLMRFNRDGTFVADPEGGLFSGDQALWGPYRLRGARLTIDIEGGYGCGPGSTATARAAIRSDNTLSLAWLHGGCPEANHDVWILRRVLLDVGLPALPPGVGPASPA